MNNMDTAKARHVVAHIAGALSSGFQNICAFVVALLINVLVFLIRLLSKALLYAGGAALLLCVLFGWAHRSPHFSVSIGFGVAVVCFALGLTLPHAMESIVDLLGEDRRG